MEEDTEYEARLREIPASEILDKILQGEPVEYDQVIIGGDLDVCKLDLPKENGKSVVKSFLKLRSSIVKGHIDFENIRFDEEVDLVLSQIEGWASFSGAEFRKPAHFQAFKLGETYFEETLFCESVSFTKAEFGLEPPYPSMQARFTGAKFKKCCYFQGSTFYGESRFLDCQFNDKAYFNDAQFSRNANFIRAEFGNDAYFIGSQFSGDVYFVQTQFNRIASFTGALFDGEVLTFKDTRFSLPIDQEDACRRAKNVLEKNGNREEAGKHFYREMDGKRKQKSWYFRYPEFIFIQSIFGYGVHPFRLIYWWLLIVVAFSFIYSSGNGIDGIEQWYDYIKVSFAIAIAPGYIAAIINPASTGYQLIPVYQAVAIIETIVGTFLWAGFIATFAKKYMK